MVMVVVVVGSGCGCCGRFVVGCCLLLIFQLLLPRSQSNRATWMCCREASTRQMHWPPPAQKANHIVQMNCATVKINCRWVCGM